MLFAGAVLPNDTSPSTTTINLVPLEGYSADGAIQASQDLWTLRLMLDELIVTLDQKERKSQKSWEEK